MKTGPGRFGTVAKVASEVRSRTADPAWRACSVWFSYEGGSAVAHVRLALKPVLVVSTPGDRLGQAAREPVEPVDNAAPGRDCPPRPMRLGGGLEVPRQDAPGGLRPAE